MEETIWTPYCGPAPATSEWTGHWNSDPALLIVLGLAGLMWSRWQRRGDSRAAVGALAIALFLFVSPFCALGSALFSVRIIHDTILAIALGPLVMAATGLHRRIIPGSLAGWTAVHIVIFLAWHAPSLYGAAMSSDAVFWTMQISITASAAMWWAKLLQSPTSAATASLLAAVVATGALGALLTFAGNAYYAPHWLTTQAWGLSPLEDQQIAGIIMWAPASAFYMLAALTLLYRSLDEPARA